MLESWDRLPDASPLDALGASHTIHRALAHWQTDLVREALAGGASWEEIGAALGTTRQAAWARFRVQLGEKGGPMAMEQDGRHEARQRAREAFVAGHKQLREIEDKWRDEQAQLRQLVRESKERLTEARQQYARKRQEAREELRRQVRAARAS